MNEHKATILSIEDDESIQEIIQAYLEASDYEVFTAATGPEGLALFERTHPDLVILDLNLPEMDGLEIATQIRKKSDVYILMLTARTEEIDRIAGLKLGADDYMGKPFSAREMVARVDAILRRRIRDKGQGRPAPRENRLRFKHIDMNLSSYEVMANGQKIELTTTEFNMLRIMMEHNNQVLSRDQLLTLVWGDSYYRTDRIVDVYAGQIRRKIEDACGTSLIHTVRGVGYKFFDENV